MMNIGYRDWNWKVVKNSKTTPRKCKRCNNDVEYELVKDSAGIEFFTMTILPTNAYYAIKCPICPEFEQVSRSVAKSLRN